MICACSSNLVDGASLYDDTHDHLRDGWMASIEVALDTAVALELCNASGDHVVLINLHSHLEGRVRPPNGERTRRAGAGAPDPGDGWERAIQLDGPADLTGVPGEGGGHLSAVRRPRRRSAHLRRGGRGCRGRRPRLPGAAFRAGHPHAAAGRSIDDVVAAACAGLAEGIRRSGMPAGLVLAALRKKV